MLGVLTTMSDLSPCPRPPSSTGVSITGSTTCSPAGSWDSKVPPELAGLVGLWAEPDPGALGTGPRATTISTGPWALWRMCMACWWEMSSGWPSMASSWSPSRSRPSLEKERKITSTGVNDQLTGGLVMFRTMSITCKRPYHAAADFYNIWRARLINCGWILN